MFVWHASIGRGSSLCQGQLASLREQEGGEEIEDEGPNWPCRPSGQGAQKSREARDTGLVFPQVSRGSFRVHPVENLTAGNDLGTSALPTPIFSSLSLMPHSCESKVCLSPIDRWIGIPLEDSFRSSEKKSTLSSIPPRPHRPPDYSGVLPDNLHNYPKSPESRGPSSFGKVGPSQALPPDVTAKSSCHSET